MYTNNVPFQNQFWTNGPVPGQFYQFVGSNGGTTNIVKTPKEFTTPGRFGTQHAKAFANTGTSVVGLKFEGGVMIAADNLISYGSLARYQDMQRVFKINDYTILGAGGDFADFQSLKRTIDQKVIEDMCYEDDIDIKPALMYNWLTRILYNRRSNMNPLWLEVVVGGLQNGKPFLGHIDLRGRAYEDDVIATGFGKHLALPLVREQLTDGTLLTREKAFEVLSKCMEVMYYRDCRAIAAYTLAICTKDGSEIQGPLNVSENWNMATMVKGY